MQSMTPRAEVKVMVLITFLACVCPLVAGDIEMSNLQDQTFSPSPPSPLPGHLKPFGSEATRLPVLELDAFPSPADFFEHYVYPSVPVIFKQGAKRSPAFEKWSDEYLKSLPGAPEQVNVELQKVEERQTPPMEMPFSEFLDRYKFHDDYLVAGVPDFLKQDVLIPPSIHCTNITANMVDTILWVSNGGTKSHVHTDYVDNINCLFRGRKDFLFVNYTRYKDQFLFDRPEGFYSTVDVERVDLNEYPEFRNIEFLEANLEAGDCLFVPFKWIHQVNSYDSNVAVNIWWNHRAYVVPTPETCGKPDPGLSLADVSFILRNADEKESLHPELDFFKHPFESLAAFMAEKGTVSLTAEQFLQLLDKMIPSPDYEVWNEEAVELGREIFKLFDLDGNGEIAVKDMAKLPNMEDQIDSLYLSLGQKMMMLVDVIDGEVSKQRQNILKSFRESKKVVQQNVTVLQEHRSESTETIKKSSVFKNEL